MSQYVRRYLRSNAKELRNFLEENVKSKIADGRQWNRDMSLWQELNYWLREENETQVDE